MQIVIEIKNVYGIEKIYPVCDKAKLFAKLVNQKTFTDLDIQTIKNLGYTFEIEQKTFKRAI